MAVSFLMFIVLFSPFFPTVNSSESAKRLPDLPVVTKRVGDASNPPTMALGNSSNFRRSCSNGLLEHCVRVVYGQDHPDRSTVLGLGAEVDILLKPEVRSFDGQLSDDHRSLVILKAVPLDRAEGGLVIVHRLRAPADRQPRGDAGLDWFGLGCTGAHHRPFFSSSSFILAQHSATHRDGSGITSDGIRLQNGQTVAALRPEP